jgi:hypothetical protein
MGSPTRSPARDRVFFMSERKAKTVPIATIEQRTPPVDSFSCVDGPIATSLELAFWTTECCRRVTSCVEMNVYPNRADQRLSPIPSQLTWTGASNDVAKVTHCGLMPEQ